MHGATRITTCKLRAIQLGSRALARKTWTGGQNTLLLWPGFDAEAKPYDDRYNSSSSSYKFYPTSARARRIASGLRENQMFIVAASRQRDTANSAPQIGAAAAGATVAVATTAAAAVAAANAPAKADERDGRCDGARSSSLNWLPSAACAHSFHFGLRLRAYTGHSPGWPLACTRASQPAGRRAHTHTHTVHRTIGRG